MNLNDTQIESERNMKYGISIDRSHDGLAMNRLLKDSLNPVARRLIRAQRSFISFTGSKARTLSRQHNGRLLERPDDQIGNLKGWRHNPRLQRFQFRNLSSQDDAHPQVQQITLLF